MPFLKTQRVVLVTDVCDASGVRTVNRNGSSKDGRGGHQFVRTLGFSDKLESEWKEAGSQAKCIASDDPRLREEDRDEIQQLAIP